MANLNLRDSVFDTKVLVFDKDGTLIDFHTIWGPRMVSAAESMASACKGGDDLRDRLFCTVGYSPERDQTVGYGPLATAPIAELEIIVATVLHQSGIPWDEAVTLAAQHLTKTMVVPPTSDEIRPRANLVPLLRSFRDAEIRLAIATTDNRISAKYCLEILGIESLIEQLLCGDDLTRPRKPSPAVLRDIADSFGSPIDKVIMVGDTVSDITMAKTAGAIAVGISGGAGSREQLEQHADVVIDSLEEISIA